MRQKVAGKDYMSQNKKDIQTSVMKVEGLQLALFLHLKIQNI
jgi:hypothetical protein